MEKQMYREIAFVLVYCFLQSYRKIHHNVDLIIKCSAQPVYAS